MKVLHVLPAIAPELGGPSEVAVETVKSLRERGIDAAIATTEWGVEIARLPAVGGGMREYRGAPVYFFRCTGPAVGQLIPSLGLYRFLHTSLAAYDVLDLHYLYTFSTSVAARACCAARVPYTLRLMGQLEPWSRAHHRWRKAVYDRFIDARLLSGAAAIQCTTRPELENASRLGLPRLREVPLGVAGPAEELSEAPELLRAHYGLPSDAKVLLYMSRLHIKKRPDAVLELLARVAVANTYALFAGTGEASYVAALKRRAAELGVADRVRFVGHIDGREKELALQGSDILVLLSQSENFAMVVAEAAIRGTCSVITEDVGISSLLRSVDHASVVSSTDQALARVDGLLSAPSLRTQLGAALKEWAQLNLSWRAAVDPLVTCYEDCCRMGKVS